MSKKALCFGLEPYPVAGYSVDHCPLIEIVPLPFKEEEISASHILFTSKTAVKLFPLSKKPVLAIGKGTAREAEKKGFFVEKVADEETQEGICSLLSMLPSLSIFWPRSDKARTVLAQYCRAKKITLTECSIYTVTEKKVVLPDLSSYDALFFTSPSTVEAFFALTPKIPPSIHLLSIGPVTQEMLSKYYFN